LVLIGIGLVATARLRRLGRKVSPAGPAAQPAWRARSAQAPASPAPAPAPAAAKGRADAEPWASDEADSDGYWAGPPAQYHAGGPVEAYPGGMDAEAAEIERLKAEIALLKATGGDAAGFKRTQALVAVGANISGILGLLVSVAALLK